MATYFAQITPEDADRLSRIAGLGLSVIASEEAPKSKGHQIIGCMVQGDLQEIDLFASIVQKGGGALRVSPGVLESCICLADLLGLDPDTISFIQSRGLIVGHTSAIHSLILEMDAQAGDLCVDSCVVA